MRREITDPAHGIVPALHGDAGGSHGISPFPMGKTSHGTRDKSHVLRDRPREAEAKSHEPWARVEGGKTRSRMLRLLMVARGTPSLLFRAVNFSAQAAQTPCDAR